MSNPDLICVYTDIEAKVLSKLHEMVISRKQSTKQNNMEIFGFYFARYSSWLESLKRRVKKIPTQPEREQFLTNILNLLKDETVESEFLDEPVVQEVLGLCFEFSTIISGALIDDNSN